MDKEKLAARLVDSPLARSLRLKSLHRKEPLLRIVNFHRVVDDDIPEEDYRQLAEHPGKRQFDKLMAHFAMHYNPVDLQQYVRHGADVLSTEKVNIGITFDDGYKDNLTNAAPICARYNIPMTLFCTMDSLDSKPLWFQQISWGVDQCQDDSIEVPWLNQKIETENKWVAIETIANSLKELTFPEAKERIEILFPHPRSSVKEEMLSWEDLIELQKYPNVGIGAHGRSHWNMTQLSDAELDADLQEPLQRIRSQLSLDDVLLAYPNGKYDDRVIARTRSAGYLGAFTMSRGYNTSSTERFTLYREYINTDPLLCDFQMYSFDELARAILGRGRQSH